MSEEVESKPVTLKKPIRVGSTEIRELDVREPSMGDIEEAAKLSGNQVTVSIRLLEKLVFAPEFPDTPITAAMLRKLPLADGMALSKKVADFFPDDPATGETA
ncbi:MAG: phage tail assembly protein [Rhodospirillaceae bacterium]|nr:phage tail assembly protein [Rhodospirillaceae bacterium]